MIADLWTSRECAEYRRCSIRTLDRERERGDGCPYIRIGARIYYRRCDVERFIAAHVCGGKRASAAANPPLSPSETPDRGRVRKAPTIAGAHAP
jgi:hypothetical protein